MKVYTYATSQELESKGSSWKNKNLKKEVAMEIILEIKPWDFFGKTSPIFQLIKPPFLTTGWWENTYLCHNLKTETGNICGKYSEVKKRNSIAIEIWFKRFFLANSDNVLTGNGFFLSHC